MLRCVSTPVRAVAFACLAGLFTFSTTTSSNAQGYSGPVWTGIYAGLHGSYVWADQEFPDFDPYPAGPPRMDLSGAFLGGQIGAQYHFKGAFVVGVEADYSRGNLSQTVRDGNFITQTGELDWTATLRGRVGLPFGSWMPYVTAGYMWAGASYNETCPDGATHWCGTAKKYSLTDSKTHGGLVYGGGVEWMISSNFSVKAEGLWFNLSEETYQLGTAPISKITLGPKPIEYDGVMFRIGGNYRF